MTTILGLPFDPNFNVYDIRESCDKPPLCYDMSPADNLLAKKDIKKILGVSGRGWEECAMGVHTALLGDWMLNLAPKVTDILEGGLDVLVYSGDKDFICNWRGGEAWTQALNWTGQAGFDQANYTNWTVSWDNHTEVAGGLREHKNLKFLRVYEAGHMVPMNQPGAALAMLKEFTGVDKTKPLADPKISTAVLDKIIDDEIKLEIEEAVYGNDFNQN